MSTGVEQGAATVTFFPNFAAAKKWEERLTPEALAERIKRASQPTKDRLPWLKLARFGDLRTEANSFRHNANVIAISGVEGDYDGEQVGFEEAEKRLRRAAVTAILYTSPSHTEDRPRWRVLSTLSTEYPPAQRDAFMARLNGIIGGIFAAESWTLSQSYYFGSIENNPEHRVAVIDGTPIDLLHGLDATAIGKPGSTKPGNSNADERPISRGGLFSKVGDDRLEAYRLAVLDTLRREAVDGQKHFALLRIATTLGGIQVQAGFSDEKAIGWMLDQLPNSVLNWNAAKRTAADGLARGRAQPIELIDRPHRDSKNSEDATGNDEDAKLHSADTPNVADAAQEPQEEFRPPEFTDEALALRFTERHKGNLRYVSAWGRWLIREPTVWQFDETLKAFDLSRAICRQASAECNKAKVAAVVASAKTVAAVERLSKADRRHAATIDQWDCLQWLLNTPGGVVDLRTGEIRAHRAEDYMTKITEVAPGGACPLWCKFLDRITDRNTDLQAFIQRVAGYSLTGINREHVLFFGYGTGANGKSTLLNTLVGIMGNYAAVAAMDTFISSHADRHPTDLAMLRGARLVIAQETEEGRRWAEARIKALTGGDPITARFMRMDFFTYLPQFKLFIAGNHKPGLRNVDEAMRRRLHLLPFNVKIPRAERDKDLPEKLRDEWPGILQWAIDGCVAWQAQGLNPPDIVQSATGDYLEAEDAMGQWITERCIVQRQITNGRFLYATVAQLFVSWKAWAEQAGEYVPSQKRFSQNLQARGFVPKRQNGTGRAGFEGIETISGSTGGMAEPPQDGRWGDL